MAQIIASGTTQASSSDFTITTGQPARISLFSAAGPSLPQGCVAWLQVKGSNNQYFTVDVLSTQQPALTVIAPGVYRVNKQASTTAFGVDQS